MKFRAVRFSARIPDMLAGVIRPAALLVCLAGTTLLGQTNGGWTLAKSDHFEVFSETSDQTVSKALLWFEQMRAFLERDGLPIAPLSDQNRPPLRIVGFRSENEYAPYRLGALASAYYTSDGRRDYILMASLRPNDLSIAAHEYSHYVLHASGLRLPKWLQEGVGEEFSTLRISGSDYFLGGDLPARSQTLQRNRRLWPVADLLSATETTLNASGRREAELFYAESWALVDMLIASPKYASRFHDLISELGAGSRGWQAFQKVYSISLEEVHQDLVNWVGESHPARLMLNLQREWPLASSFELSAAHTHFLLAELSLVSGQFELAKTRFADLVREQPANPDVYVSLGTIAMRQQNRAEAIKYWRHAIQLNVKDADLCYRFAILADEAGLPEKEGKLGLERAIQLEPGFDDARYRLALVQYHAGEYGATLENLRKMAVPKEQHRRYAYWTAMASSLLELNENQQAHESALEAAKAAQTTAERNNALQLANIANTDLSVQFATDSEGNSRMVTTRIPHGTKNWNPFIEPSDAIQHSDGKLSQVLCKDEKLTGFLLLTQTGAVKLDVADPSRVLMRNSPDEFYCGPAAGKPVAADYAVVRSAGQTRNILRGMTFQP